MTSEKLSEFAENVFRLLGSEKKDRFAKRAGVGRTIFDRIAGGQNIELQNAIKMARAWGVGLDELVYGHPPALDEVLPGWSELTLGERRDVAAIVARFARARGFDAPLPRGPSTPEQRRDIEDAHEDEDEDDGGPDDDAEG